MASSVAYATNEPALSVKRGGVATRCVGAQRPVTRAAGRRCRAVGGRGVEAEPVARRWWEPGAGAARRGRARTIGATRPEKRQAAPRDGLSWFNRRRPTLPGP